MKYPFKGDEPCTQLDANLFSEDSGSWSERAVLKQVCARCELVTECGEYAMAENLRGFWGGMTESERHKVKKKRRENSNVN